MEGSLAFSSRGDSSVEQVIVLSSGRLLDGGGSGFQKPAARCCKYFLALNLAMPWPCNIYCKKEIERIHSQLMRLKSRHSVI